jgi:O-6-methylguanine DNA methyltransferase
MMPNKAWFYSHWSKIFWTLFVIAVISLVASKIAGIIPLDTLILLGLLMVIVGAGKLSEELTSKRVMGHQSDVYQSLHNISQQLSSMFKLVDTYRVKTDHRLFQISRRRKDSEKRFEEKYRDVVKKIIEIENKVNRLSKIMEAEKSFRLRYLPEGMSFTQKVLELVKRIPKGCVTTYSVIAEVLENPKAAQAVGQALSRNMHLKNVPMHRVVHLSGEVGGYGSSISGIRKKMSLLKSEGVEITKGVVNLEKHLFEF